MATSKSNDGNRVNHLELLPSSPQVVVLLLGAIAFVSVCCVFWGRFLTCIIMGRLGLVRTLSSIKSSNKLIVDACSIIDSGVVKTILSAVDIVLTVAIVVAVVVCGNRPFRSKEDSQRFVVVFGRIKRGDRTAAVLDGFLVLVECGITRASIEIFVFR